MTFGLASEVAPGRRRYDASFFVGLRTKLRRGLGEEAVEGRVERVRKSECCSSRLLGGSTVENQGKRRGWRRHRLIYWAADTSMKGQTGFSAPAYCVA